MGKIKAMRIPEGAVVIGEHMYFKTAQNVDLKDLSEMELKKMAIRDNIKAENDAIMMYSKYIDLLPAGDPVRKGLEDIRDEEKEHAGELHQLLVTLDPSELHDFNEGVGEVKREQGVKDACRKKGAGRKAASFDWRKENAIPGAWSAKVGDGEYIVLPPKETGFDGYVVYWSSDGYALDDAIGDSLLSPKPFPTADDAKDAAEKWVREKSGSAKTAKKGAARKHAAGVPAFDEFEFDVDDDVWWASTYDGDYNISGDEGKYMWCFDNGPEYVESDGFVFDSPQEAYRDMVRNSDVAAIRTYSARNAAGKKGSLLDPEPLERFEDKWDGNMYACTTEDGVFFVKRVPDGLEGTGSFEWVVLWNLGGSDGRNGFEDPRVAFDDMLKTLYVEERRGSVMRVANGWSTDGITCILEEDNVKLFVEPELDKWRWDVNVDGELFDTGLADSMPEAQICAEDCAEKAIGHSFVAEKEGKCAARTDKFDFDGTGGFKIDNGVDNSMFPGEMFVKDLGNGVEAYILEYDDKWAWEIYDESLVIPGVDESGISDEGHWFDSPQEAYSDIMSKRLASIAKRRGRKASGKHAKRRKKAGLLLDWQDMGGGQYVVKGDLCDGVVFEDGGSWSWRLYDSKWDRFDDTYGYYGDGFGSKEEAMDDIERSLNALKRMFGSSSPKVDEVYNEKWYG